MTADPRARENPFPGLRPFMQDEAELFFGRDRQADELVRRLASRRFLAIVGTSGSGKSSLVRAGLLPSLEGGFMAAAGSDWRVAIMRPQNDPIGFLARALVEARLFANLDLSAAAAEGVLETTLRRSSLGLVEALRLARLEPQQNALIVVDQFEELFRFADLTTGRDGGSEAQAFVKLLLAATQQANVPIYVVLTMRSDFLGDCARYRDLPETINDSQYLIPRLTRDELHAVITGAVGVRGGRIAPSLVQRLVNDVGDDMDQLPILQHALMRAWDHWEEHDPETRAIELDDLDAIGGMAEALSRHADGAYATLTSDRQRSIAERLFKCLTERGADNRELRRPTPLAQIADIAAVDPAEVITVIDVFRAPGRAFLMPPANLALTAESVIDISHESLIRQWRRLRTWVEEEAESRATYLRIVEAARLHQAGRGGLWGEPDLTYARQWQERERPNAAWAEQDGPRFADAMTFLQDSEAAHAASVEREKQRAEDERRAKDRELANAQALADAQRQRADEQAAASARQKRFSLALLALLVLAAAVAFYAWQQRAVAEANLRQAESQTALALSRQLAMQAGAENRGARLALLFATAAYRAAPSVDARRMLQRALGAVPQLLTFLPGRLATVKTLAFSPDGATVLSVGADGAVTVWDVARRAQLGDAITAHSMAAVSADRKTLAFADGDKVFLWDLATRQPLGEPIVWPLGPVLGLALSPDGKIVAMAVEDHIIALWDVAERKLRGWFEGHQAPILTMAFSPDGTTLASSGSEQAVRLWDVTTGAAIGEPMQGTTGIVWSLAFSADGKSLATGTYRTITLWDIASRRSYGDPFVGHQDFVRTVAFSPDGRTLASGGDDHLVMLWDVSSRKPRVAPLRAHQATIDTVAFSADGATLASAGGGTVILWAVPPRTPFGVTLDGHRPYVKGVAVSPDSRMLASAGSDSAVILWDLASRTRLGEPLKGHDGAVFSVAFSGDGKTLASAGADLTIRLWDTATRKPRGNPLKGHQRAVQSIAFGSDSRTLASTDGDSVILWDVTSGVALDKPFLGTGKQVPLQSVSFGPDGKTLAIGTAEGTVVLWDAPSRTPIGEPLNGNQKLVDHVAFNPDGKMLASTGQDATVILWDLSSRQPLGDPLNARYGLTGVGFSPDGQTLAFTNNAGTLMLLDVATRKPLGDPLSAAGPVVFSPDGKTLVSSMEDRIIVLDLDVGGWMRTACVMANRNLTRAEWAEYVGDDVAYNAPCPELPVPKP